MSQPAYNTASHGSCLNCHHPVNIPPESLHFGQMSFNLSVIYEFPCPFCGQLTQIDEFHLSSNLASNSDSDQPPVSNDRKNPRSFQSSPDKSSPHHPRRHHHHRRH